MWATFLTLPEKSSGYRLSSLTRSVFHSGVGESDSSPPPLSMRTSIHSAHMSMQSGEPIQHLEGSASCIIGDTQAFMS